MVTGFIFLLFIFILMLMLFVLTVYVIVLVYKSKKPASATSPSAQNDTLNSDVVKQYSWDFPVDETLRWLSTTHFSLKLPISQARYNQYRQRPRELNPRRFDIYVTLSTPEVKILAAKLLKLGQSQGYRKHEQLCFTLAFVQQSIRYVHDLAPNSDRIIEYPKYPLETLMDQTGDCEDQVVLLAALLKLMGYKVALLVLPTHVALGVAGSKNINGTYVTDPTNNIHYFYTETTATRWLPGEVPPKFQPALTNGNYNILPVTLA